MPTNDRDRPGFGTLCVTGGQLPDPSTGAAAVPIYQTTSYVFPDAATAARRFDLEDEGHIYSRISNPTVAVFERRLALLDGGSDAVAVASGQAAIALALLPLVRAGQSVVSAAELYGGTRALFANTLSRMGLDVRCVPGDDPDAIRRAADATTGAVFCEMLSNPGLAVPDIGALAAAAHALGVPLIVDNTSCTPALFRPFDHGADVVVYSATKYLAGHGTTIAGAIVDGGRFDWRAGGRFPNVAGPDPAYHGLDFVERFGPRAYAAKLRAQYLRDLGPCLAPFNAFLLLQGLETLHLRMPRHCETALALARRLRAHPAVAYVNYPGLADHPRHAHADACFGGRFGGLLAFGVRGGREAARRFIESLELVLHLANIGDSRTLAIHPASTTHRQLSETELRAAGVAPDMVRVSVGLEDLDDLVRDFERALARAEGAGNPS
jgi:O-acetylhomoserine (thiol)-lyase